MNKKCLGCGEILQNENELIPGYVKDLNKDYCKRCFKLKYYGEVLDSNKTSKDYEEIVNDIPKDNLVLYVCDIFNLNLDYLKKFNKVLLVLSKRDILPKSVKDYKIIDYIKKRYKNIIDIEIISTIHNYNIDALYQKIIDYSNNKKVYLIGLTNSGKSTLLNKLIKNYGDNKLTITESMYRETTLNKIEIKLNNLTLVDTPGLLDEDNLLTSLHHKDIKKFNIKKEVKPRTLELKDSGSILIDNIIRIDYQTKTNNSITIYINNGIPVKRISPKNNTLKNNYHKSISLDKNKDIVINDICFIKFVNSINLDIYLINKAKINIRDNLI